MALGYISDGAPHRCFASTSKRAAVASFRGSRPCGVVRPALFVAHEPRARFGMREDAASPSSVAPTCRHWARRGSCLYGDECRFRHDVAPGSAADEGPQADRGGPRYSRRTHLRNRNKAGDFRRWLLETFGAERLASGAGVLDVAGGKGELAFELLNISGVPVTVVDPRQMRLDKYVRRFRSGLYHRNRAPAVRACARRPPDASLAAPAHLRLYFHAGLWTGTRESRRDAAEASWTLAHATRWSRRGLVEGEEQPVDPEETNARDVAYRRPGAPVRQRRALDPNLDASRISNLESAGATTIATTTAAFAPSPSDSDLTEADAAACAPVAFNAATTARVMEETLSRASVVVGLHPDQATDAVVDFALARHLPFAVVPCCAYSKDFPHRRRPPGPGRPKGGGAVTTTEHLVEYLAAKAPGLARVAVLPFEGKNKVVYSLGESERHLCRAVETAEGEGGDGVEGGGGEVA